MKRQYSYPAGRYPAWASDCLWALLMVLYTQEYEHCGQGVRGGVETMSWGDIVLAVQWSKHE